MSKNNILILLATALLGVLLWVVLSIVRDVAVPITQQAPQPTEAETDTAWPAAELYGLPQLNSRRGYLDFLQAQGVDATAANAAYRNWLRRAGLPTPELLHNADSATLQSEYDHFDDANLLALAGTGNAAAMQLLAERTLPADPVDALNWYRQAATYGSIHAMLRIGSLLETFADPRLDGFQTDAELLAGLTMLRAATPAMDEESLAWRILAVVSGGTPVLQPEVGEQIVLQAEKLGEAASERACSRSQRLLLELAAERRARGSELFATVPPPVFVAAANTEAVLPCRPPVTPIVDTSACHSLPVLDADNRPFTVWICTEANAT